ncbi:glycosyltransferase [Nocardia sp. NPDC057668]|uniref:glycosyltransferase n=1 Tax=Nocardia sp. NPDC057668 TaxID=3346202 RepID=UPI0036717772
MARYLVAASPIPGHVAPMLTVAADLARRGHEVRFLTGSRFAESVAAQGISCAELPESTAVPAPDAARGPTRGLISKWRTGRAELRTAMLDPIAGQFRALSAELARTTVDAVLADVMFTGVVPLLLAPRPRPAVVACGVVPLMLSSADTPPFGMGWQPRPGRDYTAMNRFVHRILFRGNQRRLDTALAALGLGPAPGYLLDWPLLADRLLQFTVPAFEYPRGDLPESVVFTGPIPAPPAAGSGPPEWWGELATARTVVHVTQGTWNNGDLGQLIAPTLTALRDRTDFLVVASTAGSPLPDLPIPANARIADFVPYGHLLPRVDVMITNGGYGGVQQALRRGVPVIVAGETADKPEVAARVAYTGTGIDLRTARPTPAAIAAAVDRILGTPDFRSAAARLGSDMSKTAPLEVISNELAELHRGSPAAAAAARNGLPR